VSTVLAPILVAIAAATKDRGYVRRPTSIFRSGAIDWDGFRRHLARPRKRFNACGNWIPDLLRF